MGSVGLSVQGAGDRDAPGELRDGWTRDKQALSGGLGLNFGGMQRERRGWSCGRGNRGTGGARGRAVPSPARALGFLLADKDVSPKCDYAVAPADFPHRRPTLALVPAGSGFRCGVVGSQLAGGAGNGFR